VKKFVLMFVAVAACAVFAGAAIATPVSRSNAVRTAHEYLQTEAFSYKSLYQQLKFEGYSNSDAAYAVSHSGADWYKEAAKDAREYLQTDAFSRSGLIGQLEFEGFTPAQAAYGARTVGL
jgi:Host cell surface-exposed lipoprotein